MNTIKSSEMDQIVQRIEKHTHKRGVIKMTTTKTQFNIGDKLEIIDVKGISGHVSYGLKDGDICTVYDLGSSTYGIHVRVDGRSDTGLIVGSEYECIRKIEAPDYKALYEETLIELNALKYPDLRLTFDEKVEFAKGMIEKSKTHVQSNMDNDTISFQAEGSTLPQHTYTIATVLNFETGEVTIGKAKCAHTDDFSPKIGLAVATYRALGWDIPQELLNGTKPNPSTHI